jgi:hypothetical protein
MRDKATLCNARLINIHKSGPRKGLISLICQLGAIQGRNMTTPSHEIDVDKLHALLCQTLRHGGAHASSIRLYAPALIDLLCPESKHTDLAIQSRADAVEKYVRAALDRIGEPAGSALEIVLCLRAGTLGRKLDDRRRIAGRYLNIEGDTFRRRHEKPLLLALAIEMCRIHDSYEDAVSS